MKKRLIIIAIVALVSLALASGIFLLVVKKQTPAPQASKVSTTQALPFDDKSVATKSAQVATAGKVSNSQEDIVPVKKSTTIEPTTQPTGSQLTQQDRKALIRKQWMDCKAAKINANVNLLWNVQIYEGIPAGGTYAKGLLDSDQLFPVRVIIKSGSQIAAKIKQMLVPQKIAFLRGNCTGITTDGAVILQAF